MDEVYSENVFHISPGLKIYFKKKLNEWGKVHFNDYPWRKETNVYRLLLAEIFLQKTDSQKIKDIYPLLWQIRAPFDLLDQPEVLDIIISKIGLSYKKERIMALSRQILTDFNGIIPANYNELRKLVGVGDYIANAVLTFGFRKKAAIVDTNTVRIVESFFGYQSKKKRAREDRKFNEILLSILPHRNHTLFNYYLLDFGALICVSSKNFCQSCPLHRKCVYNDAVSRQQKSENISEDVEKNFILP